MLRTPDREYLESFGHERLTSSLGNAVDLGFLRRLPAGEHRDLQARSVRLELGHLVRGDGLPDVVDAHREAAGVRPGAVVIC
ncbi:MAG: hypothetical protein ACRDYA_21945 [Egibacteraceae bacterium]